MTAAVTTPGVVDMAPAESSTLSRLVHAARLHLANPWTAVLSPILIFALIFAFNFAIWAIISNEAQEPLPDGSFSYNGGTFWVVVYFAIVAMQAMSLTFRYALGISLTRWEYYWGTAGFWFVLALVHATGLAVFAALERATEGWGLGGAFFAPGPLATASIGVVWFAWFSLLLLALFVGTAIATIYVRWASMGLIVFFAISTVAVAGLIYGFVGLDWWEPTGEFFKDRTGTEILALTLPVSAVAAIVGYLFIRKAPARA